MTTLDAPARRFLTTTLNLPCQTQACLAPYSSLRAGGPAQYLVRVEDSQVLAQLLTWAHRERYPFFMLGGGSNTLVADQGIDGITILNRCRSHRVPDPCVLEGDSGLLLAQLARISIAHNLTGLEWAVSVPGTVGGAIVGNAGAHGSDMSAVLLEAELIDGATAAGWRPAAALQLGYRRSRLKAPAILQAGFPAVVTRARLRLTPGVPDTIRQQAQSCLTHRRQTQPSEPSLGSMFRNPPGQYAGALIEQAGAKGLCRGVFEVSTRHANFIVNKAPSGPSSTRDVLELMRLVYRRVLDHCGIALQPEICFAGQWTREEIQF